MKFVKLTDVVEGKEVYANLATASTMERMTFRGETEEEPAPECTRITWPAVSESENAFAQVIADVVETPEEIIDLVKAGKVTA